MPGTFFVWGQVKNQKIVCHILRCKPSIQTRGNPDERIRRYALGQSHRPRCDNSVSHGFKPLASAEGAFNNRKLGRQVNPPERASMIALGMPDSRWPAPHSTLTTS